MPAAKPKTVKVKNTTEAVLDLGTFVKDGKRVSLILGSTVDKGMSGLSDHTRTIYEPVQEFPLWAWVEAKSLLANKHHLEQGRIAEV